MRSSTDSWFDEAAQERLIRWFGTREQVVGYVVACLLYTGLLALAWLNPWRWGWLNGAKPAIEAFAVFAAAAFAPMMTYFTWESELLNRLLIMKAERSEAAQLAEDQAIFRLLQNSADAAEANQQMLTSVASLLEQMQTVLTTMQQYDKSDAQDLDAVVAFIDSIGSDFPAKLAAMLANHERLKELMDAYQAQRRETPS